jgi:hypothetical protein
MQKAVNETYMNYLKNETKKPDFNIDRLSSLEKIKREQIKKSLYLDYQDDLDSFEEKSHNEQCLQFKRLKILSRIHKVFSSSEIINNNAIKKTIETLIHEYLSFYTYKRSGTDTVISEAKANKIYNDRYKKVGKKTNYELYKDIYKEIGSDNDTKTRARNLIFYFSSIIMSNDSEDVEFIENITNSLDQ